MRLYIKGDYAKGFPYGYRELAGKMWFVERDGEELSISYVGGDVALKEDLYISMRLNKWGPHEKRWESVKLEKALFSQKYESLELNFEDAFATDYNERGEHLRILSSHRDILTVDKRAMYIMAIEVASAIEGSISDDDKKSWLSVEAFREKYQEVLSLSYEEATLLSLEEIHTLEATKDPLWEEEAERRKAYILAHGGDISDL